MRHPNLIPVWQFDKSGQFLGIKWISGKMSSAATEPTYRKAG